VAGYLGNTPAVARASYVDPRVIVAYEKGRTIARALGGLGADVGFGQPATHGEAERAVISLLRRSAAT
jgi:DNA topoisomerase I